MTCYQRSGKLPVAKTRKLIVEPPKKMTYRWLQSIMTTIILTITILTMTKIDHHQHPGPNHYPHDQLTKSTSRSSDPLEGLGGGTSLPRRASVRDQSPEVGSHIALMYFSVLWMRQRARVGFDKDSTRK